MSERNEIDDLRAEIALLRGEVAKMGSTCLPAPAAPVRPDGVGAPLSRRRWIQAAAGAAVAGTAVALQSQSVAAADVVLDPVHHRHHGVLPLIRAGALESGDGATNRDQ